MIPVLLRWFATVAVAVTAAVAGAAVVVAVVGAVVVVALPLPMLRRLETTVVGKLDMMPSAVAELVFHCHR